MATRKPKTTPDEVQADDTAPVEDQVIEQNSQSGETADEATTVSANAKTNPAETEIAVFSFYNVGKDLVLKDYANFKAVTGWNFLKIPKEDVKNPETILDTLAQKGFKFSTYQLTRQQPQQEVAQ